MIITSVSILAFLKSLEAARILAVFPTPSISHQVVFRPYTQELARRGHEVTIISTDPAFPKGETPANLTEIDVHDLSYKIWRKEFTTLVQGNKDDTFLQINAAFKLLSYIFEKQLEIEDIRTIVFDKKQEFDIIVVEACVRPALILSHVFKVPVIQFSSFGSMINSHDIWGYPSHPFLYPGTLLHKLYDLNFWEKVHTVYMHFRFLYLYSEIQKEENDMIKRKFGSDAPEVRDLYNNVDMMFINVHPIWEDNRPITPGVVHVGGIHQKPAKELPKDLKTFLDSSNNGVIYISFGTNVDPALLSPGKIKMFVNVFSKLPYDVLWKWSKDELPGKSDNIRISKWFPQPDLLMHSKIKLFITQGGLQSTDEALAGGVPLIGIPMLGDQWYNVEKYVRFNIGVRLDIETLTEAKLMTGINTVINDDRYRKNVAKLHHLMHDTPLKPLDTAIWWTEYVLRNKGAKQLRSPAANMSVIDYYECKFILTLIAIAAGFLSILLYAMIILKRLFSNTKKVKQH